MNCFGDLGGAVVLFMGETLLGVDPCAPMDDYSEAAPEEATSLPPWEYRSGYGRTLDRHSTNRLYADVSGQGVTVRVTDAENYPDPGSFVGKAVDFPDGERELPLPVQRGARRVRFVITGLPGASLRRLRVDGVEIPAR